MVMEEIYLTVTSVLLILFFPRCILVSLLTEPMQTFLHAAENRRTSTKNTSQSYSDPLQRGKNNAQISRKKRMNWYFSDKARSCMHTLDLISRFCDCRLHICFLLQSAEVHKPS